MVARLFLAALLALASVHAAEGHAVLLDSAPADRARLEAPPAAVVLRFNEPVSVVAAQVLDAAGAQIVGTDGAEAANGTVRIVLPPGLGNGGYVVSYRVTSADGHAVAGSLVFRVGDAPAPDEHLRLGPGATAGPTAAEANRAVLYGAILTGSGGGLFLAFILGFGRPPEARLRRALLVPVALAAASGILSVGIGGMEQAGLSAAALATAAPWAMGLGSTLGPAAGILLTGQALLATGLLLRRREPAGLAVAAGAVLSAAALAATGHAATAPPSWLAAPAVFVHGLAAAIWVGSLWPLAVVLASLPARDALPVVRRFSAVAVVAVAVLLLAGAALSVLQIRSLEALVSTTYGKLWLAKIALAAGLLGLAAFNRRVLTPHLAAGGPQALRRSIAAELALAVAIVGLTALLGGTPPPRALALELAMTVDLAQADGPLRATLVLRPGRVGGNRLTVALTGADGRAVVPEGMEVSLSLPAAGVEALGATLAPAGGEGTFAGAIDLPLPGTWAVTVEALVGPFEKAFLRGELDVGLAPGGGRASGGG